MKKSVVKGNLLFVIFVFAVIIILASTVFAFSFSDIFDWFKGKKNVAFSPEEGSLIVQYSDGKIYSAVIQDGKLTKGDELYGGTVPIVKVISYNN